MKLHVAIADNFLKAYSKLPLPQQQKVRQFIDKFKLDPMSPGINYEKHSEFKDPNMRSVRVGLDYRAIILKPQIGNVYVLLWVDHHDEAYQWAKNKFAHIHPETGSLQILTTSEEESPLLPPATASKASHLFEAISDTDLFKLGIPAVLLPMVRGLSRSEELDQAANYLPEEASEALYALASGYSVDEYLSERQLTLISPQEPDPIDTEDFAKALANPDTLRRFVVIENDHELESLLNAPLETWRVFLHPSQRQLVNLNLKGSIRVLGGAGTGKTVVAVHRAKWLAEHLQSGNERILLTTFTKNLALDIQEHLRNICSPDVMKRIEVIHLDAWVQQLLNKHVFNTPGQQFRLTYQGPDAKNKTAECWQKALAVQADGLDLSDAFYKDEWTQIITAQGICTEADYFKASRLGRGTALNRATRKKIWPVFQELRLLLQENKLREVDDAYRDARDLLLQKPNILPYRHVIVDETQDMGEQALKLIRQIVPLSQNDLFLVGDAHQRIYRQKVVLRNCGIQIQGRHHSHRLKINYRTTDEIRKWAVSLLNGREIDDLDQGADTAKGYLSLMHGPSPHIESFRSADQELEFICQILRELQVNFPLNHICLCARTSQQVANYARELELRGLANRVIEPNRTDNEQEVSLRLATMHRIKGLEFDVVLVLGANEGKLPLNEAMSDLGDQTERSYAELRERSLLYVAATRARQMLYLTSYGRPSPFLVGG